jgi:hypothetical protein
MHSIISHPTIRDRKATILLNVAFLRLQVRYFANSVSILGYEHQRRSSHRWNGASFTSSDWLTLPTVAVNHFIFKFCQNVRNLCLRTFHNVSLFPTAMRRTVSASWIVQPRSRFTSISNSSSSQPLEFTSSFSNLVYDVLPPSLRWLPLSESQRLALLTLSQALSSDVSKAAVSLKRRRILNSLAKIID